jgi:hypothetical protein
MAILTFNQRSWTKPEPPAVNSLHRINFSKVPSLRTQENRRKAKLSKVVHQLAVRPAVSSLRINAGMYSKHVFLFIFLTQMAEI